MSAIPQHDRSPAAFLAMLERHGFRAAVMKADRVEPKQREAWVAKWVEEGIDATDLPREGGPDRA